MKKFFAIAIAALALVACEKNPVSVMKVTAGGVEYTADATIDVTEATVNAITGKAEMEVHGTVTGVSELTVYINRSEIGNDQFCAGTKCYNSNGEVSQSVVVKTTNDTAAWYTHYEPEVKLYTVEYEFVSGAESITLKVNYISEGISGGQDTIPADTVPAASNSFPRKHLLEHFTGEACGYCPSGMSYISQYVSTKTNTIWVSHHYGYGTDEYTITTNSVIGQKLGVSGAPSMALNRVRRTVTDPSSGETETGIALHPYYLLVTEMADADEACASVVIDRTYDAASRQLTLTVHGQSADANYMKFNLSVLIKENNLTGAQKDYVDKQGDWSEFRHNKVVRAMISADLGDLVECDADGNYSKSYTYTLSDKWKADDCCVVAYIATTKNAGTVLKPSYPVINAEQVAVVEGTDGGESYVCEGLKH